ncbi:MAG: hypothetical protein K2Y39_00200 [Candidatus Obscuribacterales bacterium]|nr:hypothetical protein [Candidatus Obscuribacterales bacterium]
MSKHRENTKSMYATSDQSAASGNQADSGLQKQAGQLLTDPKCNEAFAARMSTAGVENTSAEIKQAAHGGKEAMDQLNMSSDDAAAAVAENPNGETLEKLMATDIDQAARVAVADTTLHTEALHTDNVAFNMKVREQLTGHGTA